MLTMLRNGWKGKRVRHEDDGMLGWVVNVTKAGLLRICWDDDTVSRHDPADGHLTVIY